MGKRKDVNIEVPTATAEGKGFPPKIITFKNFTQWNWKYLVITLVLIIASLLIGYFLPRLLSLILNIVLSSIVFVLSVYYITKHTIKEITS